MTSLAIVAQIEERLGHITEPCSITFERPISIVEMGLVERIEVIGNHAEITLCLTDAACVHFRGMQQYISDELRDLPGIITVEVRQSLDKLWTPDRRRAT